MWKPIANYPNYAVDEDGQVKRLTSRTCGKAGHILKQMQDECGYPIVNLHANGRQRTWRVYRLVTCAFLGAKPIGYHVNHQDGHKLNSAISNLEYISPRRNYDHAIRLGLTAWGERNGNGHIPSKTIVQIRKLFANGQRVVDLARHYHLDYHYTWNVVHGRYRKHEMVNADGTAATPSPAQPTGHQAATPGQRVTA